MDLFSAITLYNGRTASFLTKDYSYLQQKIEQLSTLIEKFEPIINERHIDTITFNLGQIAGSIDIDDINRGLEVATIHDFKMHPFRSLGYMGLSAWGLKNQIIDAQTKKSLNDTGNFFRDAFIVQSAWSLENQRPERMFSYLNNLNEEIKIMKNDYIPMMTAQTDAWEAIADKYLNKN